MDDAAFYPVQDYGPVMKGLAIGGLGIVHVFLAQFAIGAGAVLCMLQWRAGRGDARARRFLDSLFTVLILVSFVLGALTGVAMWFTSIQVSPRTIGLMVDEFHWIWAIEWLFFGVEIVAGYAFYRYRKHLSDPIRLTLLSAYTFAGWMSLFWINGILSWQLTPGAWLEDRSVWSGFFNPSFVPSLLYRTAAALTIAALVALLCVHRQRDANGVLLGREPRRQLMRTLAPFFAPMALMPWIGMWYLAAMPSDSRAWITGASPAMSLFFAGAAGASTLLGLYAVGGLLLGRLYVSAPTAGLLVALSFAATAAGEFVREGVRKPYTVRGTLYSNALTQAEVEHRRQHGSAHLDPYPIVEDVPRDLHLGALVYRHQCSVCHTIDGANGVVHLVRSWDRDQMRMNIAKLQHTKAFMPPFAGTARELAALVEYLSWECGAAGEETADAATLARIQTWLDEAGTQPGGEAREEKR